ncbi:MAG: hypothetical protein KAI17_22435 [Thiotrichaceae bacterium]|nr:hypothetical protein [Thiotrichaceae bacterium]
MLSSRSLFVAENKLPLDFVDSNNSFNVNEIAWLTDEQTIDVLYQQIICKVLRKPRQLISHLQRIYFTCYHGMEDQLYAALVDLLWVLDGKGVALSQRMVSAAGFLLSNQQSKILANYLKKYDVSVLVGNQFSVFTTGVIGARNVLRGQNKLETEHDPLLMARDYIEYSQLDQAMNTLENAILETPERQVLQFELLELYKVTKCHQAYMKMNDKLKKQQLIMSVEWQDAAEYFAGLNDEE